MLIPVHYKFNNDLISTNVTHHNIMNDVMKTNNLQYLTIGFKFIIITNKFKSS